MYFLLTTCSSVAISSISKPIFWVLAIGCPPVQAPPHAQVRSTSKMAVVECVESDEAWYLTCSGSEWVGSVGNCSSRSQFQGTTRNACNWKPFTELCVISRCFRVMQADLATVTALQEYLDQHKISQSVRKYFHIILYYYHCLKSLNADPFRRFARYRGSCIL